MSLSRFQERKNNFSNINFRIEIGSVVGIVGETGSGKPTLGDLLVGLHTPTKGNIYLDDLAITEGDIDQWQAMVGYVGQDTYLSDSTILENICFGQRKENIEIDRAMRAAKIAQIHDFIMSELDEKYDSLVGERGARLSGGQRQRLGIARAIYRDPKILFLDEATSSLDLRTEVKSSKL